MAEINEVKLNGETILSTRSNTVTEDTLVQGETAQNKAGESIVGKLDPVDKNKAYLISDEIGDIDNADYMPFYDVSDQKKKKTLFGSIIEKLKSVFAQKTDLKAHTFEVGTEIPENADLNDYIEEGSYVIHTDAVVQTIQNIPAQSQGKLIVYRNNRSTNRAQIYLTTLPYGIYERVKYASGVWTDWKQLATTDDIAPSTVGNGYAVGTVSGSAITATISGFKLRAGVIVAIRLGSGLPANCTLNISNTGAKDIYYWGDNVTREMDVYNGSSVYTFMYDGTRYRLLTWSLAPTIFNQSYVADTSGNIGLTVGYDVNAFQIKNSLGSNKLVWNYYKNSAWRGDVKIADYDDLITQLGTQIPENSDLDDYTTAGVYRVQDATIASSITNMPKAVSGKLVVMAVTGYSHNWLTQIYIPNHDDGIFRRRLSDAGNWHSWINYVNDIDVGASIAKVGKNILPSWSYTTNVRVHNGITYTFNPTTGEITANGTATDNSNCVLAGTSTPSLYYIPKGQYILTGCPSGGNASKYYISVQYSYIDSPSTMSSILDTGSGATVTLEKDIYCNVSKNHHYYIFIASGQTVSNLVFKPMLRPAFTTADYEPCEDIHKGNCYVGTCTTAGATKDKEAYVDGYFVLRKGVRVAIKYSNTNTYNSTTASPVTLNVNGTGAKNIWYNTTHSGAGNTGTFTTIYGFANLYYYYVYDGTYWVWDGRTADNNNTNYLRNDAPSTMTTTIPFLYLKGTSIDTKQDNNGVTTTQHPAFMIQDKNGEVTTRLESVIETDGKVSTFMYARNYNKNTSQYFLGGIKILADKIGNLWYDIFNPEHFNVAIGHGYGVCETAEATTAKTVAISYYKLAKNGYVTVKFTYNVPANATLNINSKGAKNIWFRGANITANVIKAGDLATFIYDGTRYQLVSNDRWGL